MDQHSVVAYDDDDSGFIAKDLGHPMFDGQLNNGIGRYKRVFVEHQVMRKVSTNTCLSEYTAAYLFFLFVGVGRASKGVRSRVKERT